MATATTTPEMEHRALLALMTMVHEGPDEAAAAAVTAFEGDINAHHCPKEKKTVLHIALTCRRKRSLTIAALAARGDCNPNFVTILGTPVLCLSVGSYSCHTNIATFLAHFPTLNLDVCDAVGNTPLHYAVHRNNDTNAQLLLDAGANPTIRSREGLTLAQCTHKLGRTQMTKLLEAAEAWYDSPRRGWLRAVVCTSTNIAV